MEWCFVVTTASGNGEVRVRDNGDVVHTAGSAGWVSLDGISFPAGGAVIPVVKRNDLLRIDGLHEYAPPIHNHIVAHYTKPRTAIDFILHRMAVLGWDGTRTLKILVNRRIGFLHYVVSAKDRQQAK